LQRDVLSSQLVEKLGCFSKYRVREWIDIDDEFFFILVEATSLDFKSVTLLYERVSFKDIVLTGTDLLEYLNKIGHGEYEDLNWLKRNDVPSYMAVKNLEELNIGYAKGYLLYGKFFENEGSKFTPIQTTYPSYQIFFPAADDRSYPVSEKILFGLDVPYYPSKTIALKQLMEVDLLSNSIVTSNTSIYPGILLVLPSSEIYIKKVKLIANAVNIEYNVSSNLSQYGVKIYYESYHFHFTESFQDDLKFSYELKHSPTFISLVVYNKQTGDLLDKIEHSYDMFKKPSSQRIEVVTDHEYIERVIKQGENAEVEIKGFKSYDEIILRENKKEFLESMISFSNTNGGLIIIGVDDNKQILGFKDQRPLEVIRENLAKLIDRHCEPIISFDIELITVKESQLLLVYVQKGIRPPYILRQNNGIFKRINESDRSVGRIELDALYDEGGRVFKNQDI